MEPFIIEIAELVIQVQPMFASTREFCRNYLSNQEPGFFVEVTKADLSFYQDVLEKEALEEGIRVRKFPEPFLERETILRKVAQELIYHNTILLHGSSIGIDGQAYLFTAPCGTGKSTHTRFWREVFGSRTVMINDDKPFLRITSSGVFAYGSPWSGKHGLNTNICLPLKGICVLKRGQENVISSANAEDILVQLRHQCLVPENPDGREKAFALADAVSRIVPLWEMECTKDPSAAMVSYHAMSCVM